MNITALALSPAFPCDKTVFMAADGFGVFRTTDGNQDDALWYPINSGLTELSIISLAISPNFNRCDRGAQFNQGDSTALVGTKSGRIFKTENGGATWALTTGGLPAITTPPNYSIAALAVSPNYASDRTIFASLQSTAAGGPNSMYRSTDGGSVWLPFDAGLSDRTVQAFALSANFANDATLFVGTRFSGVSRFAGKLSQPSVAPGAAPTATAIPSATPAAGPPVPAVPIPTASPGRTSSAGAEGRLQQILYPYPSLRIIVTAAGAPDGQTAYTVPGPVIFNYLVINNGNETISNIRTIDGGSQSFCGDDPLTTDVNEASDDTQVGVIASLGSGQERALTATFLVRPSSAEAAGGTNVTFLPRSFAGCAIGDSVSSGVVQAQDDVTVQLVVWNSITPTNSELSDLWIWSFAVSPFFANDQTIFAGSAYGGLFKSSNAGSAAPTWTKVNSGLEPEWVAVRAIALSPRYPSDRTLYVGTERGIYKGVEQPDGKLTWSAMSKGLLRIDTRAIAISPDFQQDHVLFAGVWGNDLYRLRNGSQEPTWVPQRRILNGLWSWTTNLTADGVLLAGTWSGGPYWGGILGRNALAGTRGWEFPSFPAAAGGEATALAVSKTYCSGYVVFAGTWDRGLFRSTDAGSTWTAVPIPTNLPIRSVSLSPNYASDSTLYVATWGTGIYRSTDGGTSWGQLNAGLTDVMVRTVLLPPTFPTDGVVFAGTDTAGVLRWNPAQGRWVPSSTGLPNTRVMALKASPSYATDGTLAAATWGGGVAISTSRGASWSPSATGLGSPYVRAVEFSPAYFVDRALYAGTVNGAYRSSNSGQAWGLLGTKDDDMFGVDITDFAITPDVPRTIFVSTGGRGIWQYTEASGVTGLGALSRLTSHINPALPFHSFVPIAPKNRQGNVC